MSGIAALFDLRGRPADDAVLAAMLDRLEHRGPDRRGHRVWGPAALGQCTLETTPQDAFGRQPLGSADADRWIVADARLDNRDELLQGYERAGSSSHRVSDAELILRAYERWGDACPSKLLGDFAFVVWDARARRLFCARDQLGVRPLYYVHQRGTAFRCASEMHALFADGDVPRRPHRASVVLFLSHQYLERDETLWEGIRVLPPGHSLVITTQTTRQHAYWEPRPSREIARASDSVHAEHFRHVFREAVRCRLRCRGSVAAEVSGGLDSSSVACQAQALRLEGQLTGVPLTLMRLAFPGLACDERAYSQAVADHLKLPLETFMPMDDPDLCRPDMTHPDVYFHPMIRAFEPLLKRARASGIRTVLTGLGGDQLMQRTGYEVASLLRQGNLRIAVRDAGALARPVSSSGWRRLLSGFLRAFAPVPALAEIDRLRRKLRPRWPWLTPSAARDALEHWQMGVRRAGASHSDPELAALCHGLTHGPDTVLVLALCDRFSAQFGMELRHPFFDVRLIELLLALPSEQRLSNGVAKPVLRRAMKGVLPAVIRDRTLPTTFDSYLRRGFLERQGTRLRRLFAQGQLVENGFIDASWLGREIDRGFAGNELIVIDLAAMEVWLRHVVAP